MDLHRATYFVLESCYDGILTMLEESNEFSIHIGLPDRPDRRNAWKFDTLVDALEGLAVLEQMYPRATRWLNTELIQTEMLGGNVWEGIVNAQAALYSFDEDCDWVRLSRIIRRADGDDVLLAQLLKDWVYGQYVSQMVWNIINHL